MVPLLTLGIPGSASTAVMIGALMVHGIRPGPTFISQYGHVAYPFMFSLIVSNILFLVIGLATAKLSMHVVKVPSGILAPIIIMLCVIGAYALNNSLFDVGLMMFFGILGYLMEKLRFPVAAFALGLILGPLADQGLYQSLAISRGSGWIFLTRPVSASLLALSAISLVSSLILEVRSRSNKTVAASGTGAGR